MIDNSSEPNNKQALIAARAQDAEKIAEVLTEVTRQTLQEHARAGRKIPIWRDNQIVWIVPEFEEESSN